MGRPGSWNGANRKALVEETNGSSSSRQEGIGFVVTLRVNNLEVDEELSTMATFAGAEGIWMGRWAKGQKEAWRNQILIQTWRQAGGLAGAVMCETRDLGIKWLQWHTLVFELQEKVDMRVVYPKDAEKMFLQQAKSTCWRNWAAMVMLRRELMKNGRRSTDM